MTEEAPLAWIGFAAGLLGAFALGVSCAELFRDGSGLRQRIILGCLGLVSIAFGAAVLPR